MISFQRVGELLSYLEEKYNFQANKPSEFYCMQPAHPLIQSYVLCTPVQRVILQDFHAP